MHLQALVGGKREPDGVASIEQLGQAVVEFAHRTGSVHAELLRCRVRAQAQTVPDFALRVLGLAEQGAVAVATQHQPGVGLRKARQVMEITVRAEQEVAVAVALLLGRGRHDGDVVLAKLLRQRAATDLVNGRGHEGTAGIKWEGQARA